MQTSCFIVKHQRPVQARCSPGPLCRVWQPGPCRAQTRIRAGPWQPQPQVLGTSLGLGTGQSQAGKWGCDWAQLSRAHSQAGLGQLGLAPLRPEALLGPLIRAFEV